MTTPPLLANAYAATGTGPWCFQSRTRMASEGKARIARWLLKWVGLGPREIEGLTGCDESTIWYALQRAPKPFIDPAESFRRAMVGFDPMIFARNDWGELYRRGKCDKDRGAVYRLMQADGLSYPEIAKACGCRNHTGVYSALRSVHKLTATDEPKTIGDNESRCKAAAH